MDMIKLCLNLLAISIIMNILLAVYGVVKRPSMIKKIIALDMLNNSICILATYIGYIGIESVPPVYISHDDKTLELLILRAVDPLPQALIVTAIVINLSITLFLCVLTLQIYRVARTTNIHSILRQRELLEELSGG